MASFQKEYIEDITFFQEGHEYDIDFDCYEHDYFYELDECVIETNKNKRVVKIDRTRGCETVCIEILGPDFQSVDPDVYIGAELVRVVEDLRELKRNENFARFYEKLDKQNTSFHFFRFETSKGDFYLKAYVIHDKKYPHKIKYIVKSINDDDSSSNDDSSSDD